MYYGDCMSPIFELTDIDGKKHRVQLGLEEVGAEPTPDPEPTPEPEPDTTIIEAWRGESVFLRKGQFDESLSTGQPYRYVEIETTQPSYLGAPVGRFKRILQPCPIAEADIVRLDVENLPGDYSLGAGHTLRVLDKTMPERPPIPYYIGMNPQAWIDIYMDVTGETNNWAAQGPQVKKVVDLLRSFWFEPFRQNILGVNVQQNIDVSPWGSYEYSLAHLCLEGAITDPLLWTGGQLPHASVVNQINSATELYWHGPDEPGGFGMSIEQAVQWFQGMGALGVRDSYLITSRPHAEFAPFDPAYCISRKEWGEPEKVPQEEKDKLEYFGLYTSCSGHGNCAGTTLDTLRPHPDLPSLVTESGAEQYRRVVRDAYEQGAEFMLYFACDQRTRHIYEPGGAMNTPTNGWGNQDGTMLAYDPSNGDPIPTEQLMIQFEEMQRVAKEIVG